MSNSIVSNVNLRILISNGMSVVQESLGTGALFPQVRKTISLKNT
jgi:hypothetical protein